jgi:hypothetical protein
MGGGLGLVFALLAGLDVPLELVFAMLAGLGVLVGLLVESIGASRRRPT